MFVFAATDSLLIERSRSTDLFTIPKFKSCEWFDLCNPSTSNVHLLSTQMPGGRRNVLSISHMLECLHDIRDRAKDGGLTKKLEKYGHNVPFVDLSIQVGGIVHLYLKVLIFAVYRCC